MGYFCIASVLFWLNATFFLNILVMINTNCVIRNTNIFMNWNQIVNNCRAIRRNAIVLFDKFAFSKLSIFIASETLVVVMVSWPENKDHPPTCSCDQRRAGRSQDEVPLSGELQYKLPAPPQTSDIRRNHWPLARSQWTSMEVCTCPAKEPYMHEIISILLQPLFWLFFQLWIHSF